MQGMRHGASRCQANTWVFRGCLMLGSRGAQWGTRTSNTIQWLVADVGRCRTREAVPSCTAAAVTCTAHPGTSSRCDAEAIHGHGRSPQPCLSHSGGPASLPQQRLFCTVCCALLEDRVMPAQSSAMRCALILLQYVYDRAPKGNADAVLRAIDEFSQAFPM